MKLYKLIEANESLKKLNQAEGLPFKVALSLAKNIKEIDEVLTVYENKRKELINKYGKKDKDGELVIKDNNIELTDKVAFANEFNSLVAEDVDVDIKKIKVDDLENVKNLTPNDINSITFLFADED